MVWDTLYMNMNIMNVYIYVHIILYTHVCVNETG